MTRDQGPSTLSRPLWSSDPRGQVQVKNIGYTGFLEATVVCETRRYDHEAYLYGELLQACAGIYVCTRWTYVNHFPVS